MWDHEAVNELKVRLVERFTSEELVEILQLEVEDIFERFIEECLRVDWSEWL